MATAATAVVAPLDTSVVSIGLSLVMVNATLTSMMDMVASITVSVDTTVRSRSSKRLKLAPNSRLSLRWSKSLNLKLVRSSRTHTRLR